MRKIVALGLAGALAMGSIAVTAASVSAEPMHGPGWNQDWKMKGNGNWNGNWKGNWNGNGNWKHHRHNGYFPFFLGAAIGYGLSQAYPYPDAYAYDDPHVQWCAAHYRTYNPATNLYWAKAGVQKVCYSPYSSEVPYGGYGGY